MRLDPVVEKDIVKLTGDDCALVFRAKEEGVELYVSKSEDGFAPPMLVLATALAFACITSNKEVTKAMTIILNEFDKEMDAFKKSKDGS
jgi:hypothetical protein